MLLAQNRIPDSTILSSPEYLAIKKYINGYVTEADIREDLDHLEEEAESPWNPSRTANKIVYEALIYGHSRYGQSIGLKTRFISLVDSFAKAHPDEFWLSCKSILGDLSVIEKGSGKFGSRSAFRVLTICQNVLFFRDCYAFSKVLPNEDRVYEYMNYVDSGHSLSKAEYLKEAHTMVSSF